MSPPSPIRRRWTYDDMRPTVDERAIEGLKFSECLPQQLALQMLQIRLRDIAAITSWRP